MLKLDIIGHKDAKTLKSYIADKVNAGESTIDLSNVTRASLSAVQLLLSTQKHGGDKAPQFKLSTELEEILSDLGVKDFLHIREGE